MMKTKQTMRQVLLSFAALAFIGFGVASCGDTPGGDNLDHINGGGSGDKVLMGNISISPGGKTSVNTELTANYSGDETVTYQWYKNGAKIEDATKQKYTPTTTGSYTVTISASGYEPKTSAAVSVDLPELPGNISISPNTNIAINTELTANYSGSETVTYQWNKNSTALENATATTYKVTDGGSYTVTVSAENFAPKTSAAVTVTTTFVEGGFSYKYDSALEGYVISADTTFTATTLSVPAEYRGLPVRSVASYGFMNKNLTSVSFVTLSNIISIEESAFANNKITSITLPIRNLKTIGDSAFSGHSETVISIGSDVETIGSSAFSGNSANPTLGTLLFGTNSKLTTIGDYAFANHKLTGVNIPANVTSIGKNAFANGGLTSLTIPDKIESIGDNAFSANKLTFVTIGASVKTVGTAAFFGNALTTISIPANVNLSGTSMGNYGQSFYTLYNANKQGGTYTYNTATTLWTKN